MDESFIFQGITFVWDRDKAKENYRKHNGIAFEQAAEAFFDPFLKLVDASRNNEERDVIVGVDLRWNLLFVVHIEWDDDTIRIIWARPATRQERRHYETD